MKSPKKPVEIGESGYLSTRELACLLRITESGLKAQRFRRTGPPYLKYGRTVRYPRDGLAAWLARHMVAADEGK